MHCSSCASHVPRLYDLGEIPLHENLLKHGSTRGLTGALSAPCHRRTRTDLNYHPSLKMQLRSVSRPNWMHTSAVEEVKLL